MLRSEDSVPFGAYLQHDTPKFLYSLNGRTARGYSQHDTHHAPHTTHHASRLHYSAIVLRHRQVYTQLQQGFDGFEGAVE